MSIVNADNLRQLLLAQINFNTSMDKLLHPL